ncbi:MAG: translation initiation factor IF-2 subunit gamma [Nanoarchaeota archaeon]|nr:translation initiation factor IF-2 subunit gamma [Nanoarchaeota archaeon]
MDTKQPSFNLGIVGHVDHGKTTLTKLLSGKWTDTHSEEVKKGITIKLGYTNFTIYKNQETNKFQTKKTSNSLKQISIVDAPGHESFMATMISGSAIMDYALLLVAANEECPQAQTLEHIKTLEIAGIKKIIVIQNKIDLVTREEALHNYNQIKKFLIESSIYKDAPIIPLSAEYGANLSALLKTIVEEFEDPIHNNTHNAQMFIVRSFDINKPGQDYSDLKGGILGGAIRQGSLKQGDEIEIKPGIFKIVNQKMQATPIKAKITGIKSDKENLDAAYPGGSIAIMTQLDPIITQSDKLVGQVAGLPGTLPDPLYQLTFEPHLFEKVITSTKTFDVKPLYQSEPLMLIINSSTTIGSVSATKGSTQATVNLKKPIMAFGGDRVVIFRQVEPKKWRIIGYGVVRL